MTWRSRSRPGSPGHASDLDAARIVLTSSVAYRRGSAGYPPYAAAKAGIVGLTRVAVAPVGAGHPGERRRAGLIETRMAEPTIAERATPTARKSR